MSYYFPDQPTIQCVKLVTLGSLNLMIQSLLSQKLKIETSALRDEMAYMSGESKFVAIITVESDIEIVTEKYADPVQFMATCISDSRVDVMDVITKDRSRQPIDYGHGDTQMETTTVFTISLNGIEFETTTLTPSLPDFVRIVANSEKIRIQKGLKSLIGI